MGKRIVLIGAGSAQFGYGTMGDIFQSKVLEGSHVVLHDINPQSLAVVHETGQRFIADHDLPYSLSATTSRPEALEGADYCVISIEIGDRFALWEQDWRIPQQYGIRQVYGENGGPGGLFHSLRIIPPILEICGDVLRICPEATVLNFSNPMSRICTTVHRKYPGLKLVGLCHEIFSLRRHLPAILGVPYEELELVAGGLNHFSILLEARYRETGQDAYPDIRAKAPAYFERMPGSSAEARYFKETGRRPASHEELEGYEPPLPLCADESSVHQGEHDDAARRYQMINIKLDKCGGLTAGLAIAREARRRGLGLMVGCMGGTSLGMAPAFVVGLLCDFHDVDGPLHIRHDRAFGLVYRNGEVQPPSARLWG